MVEKMNTLGQRLKGVRTHYNLTPDDFAAKLGCTARALTSYEYDERSPSIEFLFNMYTVYEVNLNWLITGQGDRFLMPKYEQVEDELTQRVESILRKNGLIT